MRDACWDFRQTPENSSSGISNALQTRLRTASDSEEFDAVLRRVCKALDIPLEEFSGVCLKSQHASLIVQALNRAVRSDVIIHVYRHEFDILHPDSLWSGADAERVGVLHKIAPVLKPHLWIEVALHD